MPATRMLLLGIDGASPELLRRWADDGTLPHLSGLLARGRSGTTTGLDGFFVGSTWPSIHTGASPARHGFHYLVQLKPGTYEFYRPADGDLFDGDPFWRTLSRAGHRVAILDAPLSQIDPGLNGVQITEWGGHDAVHGFRTYPVELADSIRSRFGEHPVGTSCDGLRRNAADYETFVQALIEGVEAKTAMTVEMLQQGSWDLFMQTFSEAHCAGHQCWHLHDPTHPAHDAAIAAEVGDPLRRVYQAIDKGIGQITAVAGDSVTFVFSSHGMSHWYGAPFLLPEILFRLGVAQRPRSQVPSLTPASAITAAGTWAWHRLPVSVRGRLAGLRERYGPSGQPGSSAPAIDVDPTGSRCFHHRHGLAVMGIRLNLAGREPQGMLDAGEVDGFCRALTEDLLGIVDERSGEPLIKRVLRVSDWYQGPRLADLPDLVVDFNNALATGSTSVGAGQGASIRVSSAKIGVLEGSNDYGRTGEHRPEGLLLAVGPGITPGAFDGAVSILDLAPTWTTMFGVPLTGADGSPIRGLGTLV